MKVKLCGFSEEESLKVAVDNGCDFVGFIFYDKSPRNISLLQAQNLARIIQAQVKKVAVVVNSDFKFLKMIDESLNPDLFQFHGDETEQYISEFKSIFPQKKIIKAFRINDQTDFENVNNFSKYCDYFLFDSFSQKNYGGSGKVVNWQLFKEQNFEKDWFLSGGININNFKDAIKITQAKMIDVSSGIEKYKGQKSLDLIVNFMKEIRNFKENSELYDG